MVQPFETESVTDHQQNYLCGPEGLPLPPRKLKAGPLELLFDPETGSIRDIRYGESELLRQVYGAVRNQQWGTVQPHFEQVQIEESGGNSFRISFVAECRDGPIDYYWRGRIEGGDEQIRFEFEGEARSDFFSNRIGLCILHPTQACAGRPCEVEHADGTIEQGIFPELISPHQPFRNLRAIRHRVAPGFNFEARFEGEVFEMEDQRNWSDASFKIYGPPLERPFPFSVRRGDRIHQIVTIRWRAEAPGAKATVSISKTNRPVIVRVDWNHVHSKPAIGFSLPVDRTIPTEKALARLRALRLQHLRTDCYLWRPDWPEQLETAVWQARALASRLHLALFLGKADDLALRRLRDECRRLQAPMHLWLALHPNLPGFVRFARDILGEASPGAQFAAGTAENFAELNRNRPPADADWMSCFPINPQVHAVDAMTVMDNLAAQPETVKTARTFSRQNIVISPITLLPCPPAPLNHDGKIIEPAADPRQQSLFGAAWTLGSLAELLPTDGVNSLTYFRTIGPGGVMSPNGRVFPAYHVFSGIAELLRLAKTEVISSGRKEVAALAGFLADGTRIIWLANLAPGEVEVEIETSETGDAWKVKDLNEANVASAINEPEAWEQTAPAGEFHQGRSKLFLPPYGLVRLTRNFSSVHQNEGPSTLF